MIDYIKSYLVHGHVALKMFFHCLGEHKVKVIEEMN